MFPYYNAAVKAIPFPSLQSFLYPLEQKFVWKKKKKAMVPFIDANKLL